MESTAENSASRQALLTGLFAREDENALEPYFNCNASQRKFIDHLLADPRMVAYKAYSKAYGVSPEVARRNASRLLANADIQAAIQARSAQIAEQAEAKVEAVVLELLGLAHSDISDFMESDGTLKIKDLSELPPGASRVISEISKEPGKFGTKLKVKLWSKERALEMLGRYLAMFKDRQELSGPDDGPVRVVIGRPVSAGGGNDA